MNGSLAVLPFVLMPAIWLWRRLISKQSDGAVPCTKCGYDLRGHMQQERIVCPECGHAGISTGKVSAQQRIFPWLERFILFFSLASTTVVAALALASFGSGYELFLQKKSSASLVLANGEATFLFSKPDPTAYTPQEMRRIIQWPGAEWTSYSLQGGLHPTPLTRKIFDQDSDTQMFAGGREVPVTYLLGGRTGTYPEWGRRYSYLRLPVWILVSFTAIPSVLYFARSASKVIRRGPQKIAADKS